MYKLFLLLGSKNERKDLSVESQDHGLEGLMGSTESWKGL